MSIAKVGIICMNSKSEAKPMKEIIRRLTQEGDVEVTIYKEEMILKQPIDEWPKDVHVVIAFQSNGFPLNKVQSYLEINKCSCINGMLCSQRDFCDRQITKDILKKHSVDQPNYFVVHRKRTYCESCSDRLTQLGYSRQDCLCEIQKFHRTDEQIIPDNCPQCIYTNPPDFTETEKSVSMYCKTFTRPFLEKPINADNHKINIYHDNHIIYLFRKEKNKSSDTVQGYHKIRHDGCYLFEEFIETKDQKDLKVYTIYPNYFLCELRKAPHIDGLVERDAKSGKEIRHQTELSEPERLMAHTICIVFQQLICGFDIIRTKDGRSLVVDVNGFSFVKENEHYYDQTSQILRKMIIQENSRFNGILYQKDSIFNTHNFIVQTSNQYGQKINMLSADYLDKMQQVGNHTKYENYKNKNELISRGLISVFSQADTSPKFKFKFISSNQHFYKLFFDDENIQQEFHLRPQFSKERSNQLLKGIIKLLSRKQQVTSEENESSQHPLSSNTKSFVFLMENDSKQASNDNIQLIPNDSLQNQFGVDELEGLNLIKFLLENNIAGAKLQVKKISQQQIYSCQYIIKWGGYLTLSGLRQAFQQGKQIRQKFCQEKILPNLKVFSTNERRMVKTAQGLVLGFLADIKSQIEVILPFLNEEQFQNSDQICPDIIEYLSGKYDLNEIIPQFGMTLIQIKSKFNIENQILNFHLPEVKKALDQQLDELNEYLQMTQSTWSSPTNNQNVKLLTAFKQQFDPCLIKLKRKLSHSLNHQQCVEMISSKVFNIFEKLEQSMKINQTEIPLASLTYDCDNKQKSLLKSFKYTMQAYMMLGKNKQYDVSKLLDINNFLQFLIVHHKPILQQDDVMDQIIDLYQIVHIYYEQLMLQFYGATQLQKLNISQKIAYNLLQTIQQDIDSAYNYFRECDKKIIYKNSHFVINQKSRSSSPKQSTNSINGTCMLENDKSDSKLAKFAQMSSQQNMNASPFYVTESTKQRGASITSNYIRKSVEIENNDDERGEQQVRFYITDKAHMYSLYNLLTSNHAKEIQQYLQSNKQEVFNYMSSIHFVYHEMFDQDYFYKLKTQEFEQNDLKQIVLSSEIKSMNGQYQKDLTNSVAECDRSYMKTPAQIDSHHSIVSAPHRFVEVMCSCGTSQDIFQPVIHNVLPVDANEKLFSLFPFVNISSYNNKLNKINDMREFNLVSVVGIYRHGDRCPKQKAKVNITTEAVFEFIVKFYDQNPSAPQDISVSLSKESTINDFIVQFKEFLIKNQNIKEHKKLKSLYDVVKAKPPALKLQIKFPTPFIGIKHCTILAKYGGMLTNLGESQARLCAELLHQQIIEDLNTKHVIQQLQDLKSGINVFVNDEQRVKDTAKYFMERFCELFDVDKLPDLVELEMLSKVNQRARSEMDKEKELIHSVLSIDQNLMTIKQKDGKYSSKMLQFIKSIDPEQLEEINNPVQKIQELKHYLDSILQLYTNIMDEQEFDQSDANKLALTIARFSAVYESFIKKDGTFNVSKIPDIYDLVRHDILHQIFDKQSELLNAQKQAYEKAKVLAKFIAPNEFGTNKHNRIVISSLIGKELFEKIDEAVQTPGIDLFFVSESHITALINIFVDSLNMNFDDYDVVDFMSHLIVKVYKNSKGESRLEIYVSSGSYQNPFKCEYGVPRITIPKLIGDNYNFSTMREAKRQVENYNEMAIERYDLGFPLLNQGEQMTYNNKKKQ